MGQKLKQDRNLEAGDDAEATEGCCFIDLLIITSSAGSYRIQDEQIRTGTTHSHLGSQLKK